ncbi:MAG: hypothetical protein H6738_01890 [Alphaproteobacteria bacterium]|nr:hypothetical protein [Alphaproteobacteria bacterium]MCB9695520.1 hypothetical protein [Alphaproteobacteria bacterium]
MNKARWTQLGLSALVWGPITIVVACGGDKDGELPPDDELQFEDFGTIPLSDTGGYVEATVTVPDGAVSTMAWCGGFGDGALGAVWTLTDPSGSVVYTGDAPDAGGFRSDFLDDLVPALIPVTPDLTPTPGAWTFQWFVGAGSTADPKCGAVHRVDTLSDPATIAVDLVFVSVAGLDATSAQSDEAFQAAIAQLESEWANAGLTPVFNYLDFSGDTAKYSVVDIVGDDYGEFNDLLRTSSPDIDRVITFFLVEEISSDGATILGLSGGPPGAAAVHGTSKSGVIVTTVDLQDEPTDVGKIMAHEGGHFLGLFHTTEMDGTRHDPLGDTPTCSDGDGNGIANSAECAGKGAENMMWWTLTEGVATATDDQSFVVRSNPVSD